MFVLKYASPVRVRRLSLGFFKSLDCGREIVHLRGGIPLLEFIQT